MDKQGLIYSLLDHVGPVELDDAELNYIIDLIKEDMELNGAD